MARIRSVKPELCTSETMAHLPAEVERTFVRLWTHMDDEGRCKDDPRLIKAALFPLHDDVTAADVDGHLWALASGDDPCILRYEVAGKRYIACPSWGAHQHPQKPRTSTIPSPDNDDAHPVPKPSRTPPVAVAYAYGPVVEGSGVGGGSVEGVEMETDSNNVSEIPSPPPLSDRSADDVEQEARRSLRLYADTVTAGVAGVGNFASYSGGVRKAAMGDGTMSQIRVLIGRGMSAEDAAAALFGPDPLAGPASLSMVPSADELAEQRARTEAQRQAMLAATEAEVTAPRADNAAHIAAIRSGAAVSGVGGS